MWIAARRSAGVRIPRTHLGPDPAGAALAPWARSSDGLIAATRVRFTPFSINFKRAQHSVLSVSINVSEASALEVISDLLRVGVPGPKGHTCKLEIGPRVRYWLHLLAP